MFSSRLFTTEAPVTSQTKAGKLQAGTETLAAGENTVNEQTGSFAKEFQAVVNEEQSDTGEPLAASEEQNDTGESLAAASEEQNDIGELVAEPEENGAQVSLTTASAESNTGVASLPNEDTGADSENSTNETISDLDEQISVGQVLDKEPGLDSTQKQQIMSDGKELLNRLSESNRQLAGSNTQWVTSEELVSDGNKLPPENGTENSNILAAQMPAVAQAADTVQPEENTQEKIADDGQTAEISQEELAWVFAPQARQQTAAELSSAEAAVSDMMAPELSAGKVRAGTIPSMLATTNAALLGGQSQPLGDEAAQFADSADSADLAGIAAGNAALSAMEHGMGESNSEAKAAEELSHSLSALSTLRGQVNGQARAEATLVQSPLQLSKEQAGDQLAERMQMMVSKDLKHVDIRLDPPELGKLQIKLSLNQDQASVQFTVGNQQTRDLVEQAMPRLRELLSQQGLQLAQSSVQQDSSRQQFAGQPNQHQGQPGGSSDQHHSGSSHGGESRTGSAEPVDMYVSQRSDRVDYYA